jgi:pyrimidine-nucleoside phosphorylase
VGVAGGAGEADGIGSGAAVGGAGGAEGAAVAGAGSAFGEGAGCAPVAPGIRLASNAIASAAGARERMRRASRFGAANPSGMTETWVRQALDVKRTGGVVPSATWERLIDGYVDGSIDEAPIAALLMASAIRGLNAAETQALTEAMIRSGDTIAFDGTVVDKHSTGGVGDSVSLIVVPLVASCGVSVAKLSGRALGHTGGTLDKLESIPGVRTSLAPDEFRAQVERIGCAITAQSERLVPADKRLYDLRDRTGTVASVGLIAASIVSKKIAGGASAIVFDVKTGAGAFMATLEAAVELSERMVEIAARLGRRASALITDMDEPLGPSIGNALEAIEARDFLAGASRDARLNEVVRLIAAEMLRVGGATGDVEAALEEALTSGRAYEKFVAMLEAQGGSRAGIEGMRVPERRVPVRARRDGSVAAVNAMALGELARVAVDRHGSAAGIIVRARVGDAVHAGDALAEFVGAGDDVAALAAAFTIEDRVVQRRPLLHAVVRDADLAVSSNARSE